jgi:hypothetical protein
VIRQMVHHHNHLAARFLFASHANSGGSTLAAWLAAKAFTVFFIIMTASLAGRNGGGNRPKSTRSCRCSVRKGHHYGSECKAQRNCEVSIGEGLDLRFAVCK